MSSKVLFENFIRRELSNLNLGNLGPNAVLIKFSDLVQCCMGITRGQIEEIFEDDLAENGNMVS